MGKKKKKRKPRKAKAWRPPRIGEFAFLTDEETAKRREAGRKRVAKDERIKSLKGAGKRVIKKPPEEGSLAAYAKKKGWA